MQVKACVSLALGLGHRCLRSGQAGHALAARNAREGCFIKPARFQPNQLIAKSPANGRFSFAPPLRSAFPPIKGLPVEGLHLLGCRTRGGEEEGRQGGGEASHGAGGDGITQGR